MRDLDKFRGCLLAGAAGDALGYEVEFMREKEIFTRFGEHGITEYCLHNGLAKISDDTQMTLFTATGLLYGNTRSKMRGIMGSYEGYIRYHYKDWYRTQTEKYPLSGEYHYSWLVNVPELFSRRAPGNSCMAALSSDNFGTTEEPINHSKGCGSVMRVAPVGLYFCDSRYSIEDSDRIGAASAALTHGHELAWLPSAAMAHIVRQLAEHDDVTVLAAVQDAMATLQKLYPQAKFLDKLLSLLQKAVDLSADDRDDLGAIHLLGEGWTADEALAIAVYCALKYPDNIEKALIAAVNHKGDSDSTGSIAGNILGASLGMQAIPRKFLENLELRDLIQEVADDLYNDCKMTEYGDYRDSVWEAKYILTCYPKMS